MVLNRGQWRVDQALMNSKSPFRKIVSVEEVVEWTMWSEKRLIGFVKPGLRGGKTQINEESCKLEGRRWILVGHGAF